QDRPAPGLPDAHAGGQPVCRDAGPHGRPGGLLRGQPEFQVRGLRWPAARARMTTQESRGFFVAAGYQGQRIVSRNGRDWTNHELGREGEVYRTVAFGKGRAVAV